MFGSDVCKKENLKDCKEVSCNSRKESIKDDGLETVLVRDGERSNDDHSTIYLSNVCEALQRQINLCEREHITLAPRQNDGICAVVSRGMSTPSLTGATVK